MIGSPIEMSSGLKAGAAVAAGANADSGRVVLAAGAASIAPAKAPPQTAAATIANGVSSPILSQALPVKRRFEIWRRVIDRILMRAVSETFNTITGGTRQFQPLRSARLPRLRNRSI